MEAKQQEMVDQAIRKANVTNVTEKAEREQKLEENKTKLMEYIRSNVIGSNLNSIVRTPFGEKPQTYIDYTASGKSLKFIESYLETQVLPVYANTHSTHSTSGKQTIAVREEARHIIKRVCNANEDYAAIFTGSGCTHAVKLLLSKLKVKEISESVKFDQLTRKVLSEDDRKNLLIAQ